MALEAELTCRLDSFGALTNHKLHHLLTVGDVRNFLARFLTRETAIVCGDASFISLFGDFFADLEVSYCGATLFRVRPALRRCKGDLRDLYLACTNCVVDFSFQANTESPSGVGSR